MERGDYEKFEYRRDRGEEEREERENGGRKKWREIRVRINDKQRQRKGKGDGRRQTWFKSDYTTEMFCLIVQQHLLPCFRLVTLMTLFHWRTLAQQGLLSASSCHLKKKHWWRLWRGPVVTPICHPQHRGEWGVTVTIPPQNSEPTGRWMAGRRWGLWAAAIVGVAEFANELQITSLDCPPSLSWTYPSVKWCLYSGSIGEEKQNQWCWIVLWSWIRSQIPKS